MAITTAEEFFAIVEKSKLFQPEQLAEARSDASGDDDPKAVARVLVGKGLLTRWQAGQLLAGRSSFFLGKYKLIELIGRGGMGSVFLGQHVTMNRRVALKIISRQVRKDPASLERFLSEARAIAALDHPNIVQAYSVDNEGDRYYIVMEFVDGQDLQQMVEANGPLDYDTAADYIRQAADGLQHGHEQKMIHCDIKPSNLLVNQQGVVKIVDMGLTRLGDPERRTADSQDENVLGSVDYLAPEQALEANDFDHRADIYSLGCTLYFLLTGHPPFPEGLLHERLMKHQSVEPESITQQRGDAPARLVQICQRMMAKNPEDRYRTATELSKALAAWRPPVRKPKRAVPLATTEGADESNGELAGGSGMPTVNTGKAPPRKRGVKPPIKRPAAAGAAVFPGIQIEQAARPAAGGFAGIKVADAGNPAGAASSRSVNSAAKAGFLSTPKQKIIAAVIAGMVVVGLATAATIPFLLSPGSGSTENQVQAGTEVDEPDNFDPGDERLLTDEPPSEEPPSEELPSEEPPSEEPPGREFVVTEPPAEEPPAEEPPAEEPPSEEPPTEEPPTEDPPAEEPPTEEPPAEEPKKDPFSKLAATGSLVPLVGKAGSSQEPIALATLALEPDSSVGLELLGGETAMKSSRKLVMESEAGGRSWSIRMPESATLPDVGKITLDGETLNFEWAEGATATQVNCLLNCGLDVTVDYQTRFLPLAAPEEIEPLAVELTRGSFRANLPAARLPDPSILRLQITSLEGAFPKHSFKPADTISANEELNVLLSKAGLPQFGFNIKLTAKGRIASVLAKAVCQLTGQPEPRQFIAKEAAAARRAAMNTHRQMQAQVNMIRDKKQRETAEQQLTGLDTIINELNALDTVCKEIHDTGKIHFRVYAAIDDEHEIDLFRTIKGGAAPPDGD